MNKRARAAQKETHAADLDRELEDQSAFVSAARRARLSGEAALGRLHDLLDLLSARGRTASVLVVALCGQRQHISTQREAQARRLHDSLH